MTVSTAGRMLDVDAQPEDLSLAAAAAAAAGSVPDGLVLAREIGASLPPPGAGDTLRRWAVLAMIAEQDLTVARILEAHADALAILGEAGVPRPAGAWGVFAAEAPDVRLVADEVDGRARLTGTKPWCSIAAQLDGALVTAHCGDTRRLYAVDLGAPSVHVHPARRWVARGLTELTSGPVDFTGTTATPVGAPGWYLDRDGFAWGGIGVAACWFGGAVGLYTTLRAAVDQRTGDLATLHLGIVDAALSAAAALLRQAAAQIDAGHAGAAAGALLAHRVRAVVADAAERTLVQVGHALGPAPLAFDEAHARRVADLTLYLRQHHAERDLATLGRAVLALECAP